MSWLATYSLISCPIPTRFCLCWLKTYSLISPISWLATYSLISCPIPTRFCPCWLKTYSLISPISWLVTYRLISCPIPHTLLPLLVENLQPHITHIMVDILQPHIMSYPHTFLPLLVENLQPHITHIMVGNLQPHIMSNPPHAFAPVGWKPTASYHPYHGWQPTASYHVLSPHVFAFVGWKPTVSYHVLSPHVFASVGWKPTVSYHVLSPHVFASVGWKPRVSYHFPLFESHVECGLLAFFCGGFQSQTCLRSRDSRHVWVWPVYLHFAEISKSNSKILKNKFQAVQVQQSQKMTPAGYRPRGVVSDISCGSFWGSFDPSLLHFLKIFILLKACL